MGALGILFAAASLINLAAKVSNLELVGVYLDFVTFYRKATHLVFGFVPNFLFHWEPPSILLDLWSLSFWMTAIQMVATKRASPDYRGSLPFAELAGQSALVCFLGYSLIGLGLGVFMLSTTMFVSRETIERNSDDRVNMTPYVFWLHRAFWISIASAIVFFGLNAYSSQ